MVMRRFGLGGLACVVALSSCGGDTTDGGVGPGAASVPLDDVLPMLVDMQCDAFQQCAGDFFDLFLQGMDCKQRFGLQFEDGSWEAMKTAVEEGRVVYDGTKTQACMDAYRALGCDILTSRAPAICEEALAGTVDAGGDCKLDAECKGELFCKVETSCPGKCAARQGAGSSCFSSDACENGLVCGEDTGKCEKPRAKGESCEGGQPDCELGLLCLGAEAATPGTCTALSEVFKNALGDTCDIEKQSWCEAGLACVVDNITPDSIASTCQQPKGSGEACKFGIPSPCPATDYCDADIQAGSIDGTCVALPKEGDACVTMGGLTPCAAYHVCVEGTCRELKRNGQTCAAHEACYSEYCKGGTCSPTDACSELDK